MTIAQSEDSCVVYGMPKAAIERGYAIRVVALDVMSSHFAGGLQPRCAEAESRQIDESRKLNGISRLAVVRYRDLSDLPPPAGMICSRKGKFALWNNLHQ